MDQVKATPGDLIPQPIVDRKDVDVGSFVAILWSRGNVVGLEFPKGSGLQYLTTSPFFGCIKGVDTLVSAFAEFSSYAPIKSSSNRPDSPVFDYAARAAQQYAYVFYDTTIFNYLPLDEIELRLHRPIGLEVHVTSYAWSDTYSKQFVLLDYRFKNISDRLLSHPCVGIGLSPRIQYWGCTPPPYQKPCEFYYGDNGDDLCGFFRTVPGVIQGETDSVGLFWGADNDGDPEGDVFTTVSATGVAGARVLRVVPSAPVSFNWYAREPRFPLPLHQTWGPRNASDRAVYRGSLGQPIGDRGLYHLVTNGEVDYDQVYTAMNRESDGWAPPPSDEDLARDIADGANVYGFLSAGPLPDLEPGDSVVFTVALVVGAGLHQYPKNLDNFDPLNPKLYLSNLNFSEFITNARWADWVFDNPGIDTDGNGNRGRAYLVDCDDTGCDSVFYKGDGIPDWRGPSAPPPPTFEFSTGPGSIILRWIGNITESFRDPFSGQRDFEGYRVYLGKFNQDNKYSLISSWDREDYKRMVYDSKTRRWNAVSYPHSKGEWQVIIDDLSFNIDDYRIPSLEDAYQDTVMDTIRDPSGVIIRLEPRVRFSYWAPEDFNRTNEYWETDHWESNLIQRVEERDTVVDGEPLTYGVYEVELSKLNPSVPMFVAVTAFDFGDYQRELLPLETSPSINSEYAEFIYSSDVVIDSGLRVSVFPNPYKIQYPDAHGKTTTYYLEGYEGRGVHGFVEQDRRIHFINLPDTATIRIWSLDGDLIREIHHPDPFLTTYSSSVGWDLISRNAQAVVSGIYIWRVDSRLGSQVGKLVIIK